MPNSEAIKFVDPVLPLISLEEYNRQINTFYIKFQAKLLLINIAILRDLLQQHQLQLQLPLHS